MNGHTFGRFDEPATLFVYGANRHAGTGAFEPRYLIESNLEFGGAPSIFGREEYVWKIAEKLLLAPFITADEFTVSSFVGGYVTSSIGSGMCAPGSAHARR